MHTEILKETIVSFWFSALYKKNYKDIRGYMLNTL